MSVWKRKWKDASGLEREAWVVDVQAIGKDGRIRRVRRVSDVQTRRGAYLAHHEHPNRRIVNARLGAS